MPARPAGGLITRRGAAAVRMVCCATVLLLAGCRGLPEGTIRFCEAFSDTDTLVGEDVVFSTGAVSMLLSLDAPLRADALRVSVARVEDSRRIRYGDDSVIRIEPGFASYRLDQVVSFADTGRFVVTVWTRDRQRLAEAMLRIVGAAVDAPRAGDSR